ncbi:MAG: type IV secretion system DNA-binding domain-containing protein [Dehalococcoidia bacterium]|nr:type IV secretion system DNA-binding domain-containing protein [Dehalococcoidia bacterium]
METVSLGLDIDTEEEVRLGLTERRQGLYIIGKTGTGKTTLLEHLIVQDIEAGLGVCVLDPHGDLIDAVLARIPADHEERVILLDLADSQYPFGLNLFECRDSSDRNLVSRVATQAVEVFEKLWGDISWGPQLAQVLRNCAYTLIENQGYTMTEIRRLLLDDQFRARLTANVSNPQVREFWELEYAPLRDREQQQLVRSTLNKVDEFLTPVVFPIVGFGRTTVDFRKVMDNGQILLVQLAVGQVGAGPVSLIGSMIVGQLFNAALSRQELPPGDRRQFNLYADEYHRFATPAFADLLAEARKYALATTLAHQFRGQLTDEPNRGATLNAANLVVFGVHGEDGEELAKQFDRTPPPPAVAGLRPKLAVSQDPVSHLVRNGHESKEVRRIVQYELQFFVNELNTMAADDIEHSMRFKGDPAFPSLYHYNRATIIRGIRAINAYLIELMEGRSHMDSNLEALLLVNVVNILRAPMGIARVPVEAAIHSERMPESELAPLSAYLEQRRNKYTADRVESLREELVASRERAWGGHRAEVDRLDENVEWLRTLGAALVEAPVLVDSGQWEPYLDHPRSYSDVEAEIASTLVGLQKYQARCRLLEGSRTVEHKVHTPEFEHRPASPDATGMITRIRNKTRANYCAPLADILDAIRERQMGDDGDSKTTRRAPI